jgi:hypothetical protein
MDESAGLNNLTITKHSVSKLSEMAALGLGLEAEYFSNAGRYGFVKSLVSSFPDSVPNVKSNS